MDELTIDGKTYVSSKRAAAITGYAKDYIGQLCREGRVEARLVGRSWYAYEPSLKKHRFNEVESVVAEESVSQVPELEKVSEKTNIEAVWEAPVYVPEETKHIPEIEKSIQEQREANLSDMQSAWQDWFSKSPEQAAPLAHEPVGLPKEEPRAELEEVLPEPVTETPLADQFTPPVRVPMNDIRPVIDTKSIYEEPVVAAIPSVEKKGKRRRRSGTLVVRALLVAFIVICISFTLVITGLIETLPIQGLSELPIIQSLGGESVIKR